MSETIGAPSRLRDALRAPTARGREIETVIALAMHRIVPMHGLNAADAIRGLMGNIVAVVMAKTQTMEEAREIGEEICAEFMRRLTQH